MVSEVSDKSYSLLQMETEDQRSDRDDDLYDSVGLSGGSLASSRSTLYSEDDSVDSDHATLHRHLSSDRKSPSLHRGHSAGSRTKFTSPLKGSSSPLTASLRRSQRENSPVLHLHTSLPSLQDIGPQKSSYFHQQNTSKFSIKNELLCIRDGIKLLHSAVDEDCLPWLTDFADLHKMRLPKKPKEIGGRLNLNIPYYSSNYIEIFYVLTFPFLLFYNPLFFVVLLLACFFIQSTVMRKKVTQRYGAAVIVLGRKLPYRILGHIFVCTTVVLSMFFNGLATFGWVLLINLSVVIPHAILRKPTYFDDEDLEKCRPKLVQYALMLLFLGLAYLEGDCSDADELENVRAVAREKKRLKRVLAKREKHFDT